MSKAAYFNGSKLLDELMAAIDDVIDAYRNEYQEWDGSYVVEEQAMIRLHKAYNAIENAEDGMLP